MTHLSVCTYREYTHTLKDGIGGGVGVNGRHIYGGVLGFGHAGEDQAVHAVQ